MILLQIFISVIYYIGRLASAITIEKFISILLFCWCLSTVFGLYKMALSSFHFSKPSPGLLPTPSSPPYKNLSPDCYVGSSYFPLPYQLVLLLEGCPLDSIVSWDISVSKKQLKLKLVWSLYSRPSTGCLLREVLPSHIFKSISSHDLGSPSWSTSCSSSQTSLRIDWPLNKLNSSHSHSSPTLPTPSQNSSLNFSTFTPVQKASFSTPIPDSGYQSFNSRSGCRGASSSNWRQNISPPSKPNFVSPVRKTIRHDVFVPKSKPPPPPSVICNENSGCSPEKPCISTTSNILNNTTRDLLMSDSMPQITEASPESNKIISSPTDTHSDSDSDSVCSDDVDLANKIFLPTPSPLPISDGFIDPDIDAHFMNISGSCRLCHAEVSSYLIDAHLIECTSLDGNFLSDFIDKFSSTYFCDPEDVIKAAKTFLNFQLTDSTCLSNDIFSDISVYRVFTKNIEDLIVKLVDDALVSLKLSKPPNFPNFNLLYYK